MLGINVLVIVGSCESSFSGTLAELAGENSPDGIRVSVFDCLDELPPFSETPASTVDEPARASAFRRGGPKHGQLEPVRPAESVGRLRPWKNAVLAEECSVKVAPISREIQIVSRDTIAAPMLFPKTSAPVHGGSNNKFLARPPRTAFL
jgi:hypothetical protein